MVYLNSTCKCHDIIAGPLYDYLQNGMKYTDVSKNLLQVGMFYTVLQETIEFLVACMYVAGMYNLYSSLDVEDHMATSTPVALDVADLQTGMQILRGGVTSKNLNARRSQIFRVRSIV